MEAEYCLPSPLYRTSQCGDVLGGVREVWKKEKLYETLMNKQRRQQLYDATAALDDAIAVIQDVQAEEDDAFNNLSEGLQCSRTGEAMQDAIDVLDGFVDEIEAVKTKIEKFAENKN